MAKEPPTPLGRTIRKLRTEKGLTLAQLAELLGLKKAAIHKIEAFPTSNPQLTTLQRLAGALGVSVAQLVTDVLPIPPQDTAAEHTV